MAAQWYANPSYNNQSNHHLSSNWDDAVLMQDPDYSDVESSTIQQIGFQTLSSQPIQDNLKKKQISNLPPFEVAPKKVSSTAHPLSIRLQVKRDVFSTSGLVEGELEIICLKESSAPKLGKIAVYLVGFEETRKSKTRNFFVKKWIIQDPNFAPSDAVHAGVLDEDGMWNAKKGTSVFPFAIPFEHNDDDEEHQAHIVTDLESDSQLPSSYWNAKVGGVRYILAGVAENKLNGKIRNPIAFYHEIFVIEGVGYTLSSSYANLSARTQPLLKETSMAVSSGFLGLGKKGSIQLGASLRTLRIQANNQEPGVWKSGDTAFIGIDIKNESPKKVVYLEVSLIRILKTFKFDSVGYRPVSFSKMIAARSVRIASKKNAVSQRGNQIREAVANGWQENQMGGLSCSWAGVDSGSALQVLLHLDIPKWARTIRYASLIDVSFEIVAKIGIVGGKFAEVNIPITILHPSSLLEDIPKIDILAPPEVIKEGVAGHVSYINVKQVVSGASRAPSPAKVSIAAVEEQEEVFPQRVLHKEDEPLPAPQLLEEIKAEPEAVHEPVFTSQTTLADSNSSLGDQVSPIFSASKRASTLSARKTVTPLKSFVAVSRASTARRSGGAPIVSRPSPAALKFMASTLPDSIHDAPSVLPRDPGAKKIYSTTNLDDIDGVAKFDLDSEIDKMFSVVQMD